MSERSELTVVTYDMSDDKRRRRLVRVLESWGYRVQESVFEAWTTKQERLKLKKQIRKCLNESQDQIAIYVLPAVDCADIRVIGTGALAPNDRNWIV